MRITRLVAGSVTAGLLGLTPIAVAAPSQAADNWTTTTTATPDKTAVVYGEEIYVNVDVNGSDGLGPSSGTSTLYAMEAGSTAWVPVATGDYPGSDFYPVKPTRNTTYKVVFGGYTDPVQTAYSDNYAASESATFSVEVARKITYPSSGFVLKGKVSPNYGKKKIVIKVSKKQNKGYKSFKKIKTTKAGKYKITLPRRGGTWYWSFVVKGDAKYAANGFVWKTFVG
jgi:hypothetical protein